MSAPARIAALALLAAVVLSVPASTDACAPAPPRDVIVEVASESAVIIWDSATKTQHFIRRATFKASGKDDTPVQDFGFLVPTPTQPTLAEADDRIFDQLARITEPVTETHKRAEGGGCGIGCAASAPKGESPGASVEVLEEKRVAGYDAKVLKANDATVLTGWLNERGYEVRPALTRWLQPYIDRGWVVTAFKIARDAAAPKTTAIGSTAVRMSFKAEQPFFPYREPDDMHDAKGNRLLRVFFVSDFKATGTLSGNVNWPGKVVWAGTPIGDDWVAAKMMAGVPDFASGKPLWLTEFEDASSPRPGTEDLVFSPHPDQTPVERPHRIVYAAAKNGALPTYAGFAVMVLCVYLTRHPRLVGPVRNHITTRFRPACFAL